MIVPSGRCLVPQVKTAVAPASGLSRPSIYDLSGLVHPRRLAPPSGCWRVGWGVTGGGRCARPPAYFSHPCRGGRAGTGWASRGAGGQGAAKDGVVPDGGRWKPAPSGLRRWGGPVPRVVAARRTLGSGRISLQDMRGPGNRLVSLFVNMARINGMTSCQRGGSKRWERQVHSPQRVTWTHRPGGLWPRAVWAIEECPFRTWLGRVLSRGMALGRGTRPHGPCVRGEGGLRLAQVLLFLRQDPIRLERIGE